MSRLILGALLFLIPGLMFSVDIQSEISNILFQQQSDSSWVVQIEGLKLDRAELEAAYKIYQEQMASHSQTNDTILLRKAFLDTYIQQNVIIKRALEENFFQSPEMQIKLKILMMQNLYQLYLNEQIDPEDPALQPTSEEMNQMYMANKQQFQNSGLSAAQLQQAIRSEITQQKLSLWLNDFVNRSKEAYHIKRNSTLLKKMGFE